MEPGSAVREAAAAGDYGTVIRLCRQAQGMTLHQLADLCSYSHSAVSRLERRGSRGGYDVSTLQRFATALGIPPHLLGLAGTALVGENGPDVGPAFPTGRLFTADMQAPTETRPAYRRGEGFMVELGDAVPTGCRVVVGGSDSGDLVAMDVRHARRRLARSLPHAPLLVPSAYTLDDLTIGVIWAVANLDEPVLRDDARLDAARRRVFGQHKTSRSSGEATKADDLHPVSKMWLGSDFCARHILHNMTRLRDTPTFWTQERRGEEASAWLLFAHKLEYLRQTTTRFRAVDMVRAFCVPSDVVEATDGSERVLFVLAAALMESFGIEVAVCVEPGYSGVEGCVLDGDRQAIVASWVGVDALWHVDITEARPSVLEYRDALRYAQAHSVVGAPTPPERLHALADFVGVDWEWLARRCRELSEYGTAGLAEPSSRLLSVAGVDRACRFLATA